ncbi:MAG: HD domain-containing protein [Desulfuromonadales bacterium]|nr:HD domain-containing protein [Desulfuromonadales bacterium]NIR34351.1 HD domain-containing protein [Desulfuromonadales bacterium]NIS40411.1 HD domain-containing protein [Desulfuromonadales bacterium]
MTARIIEEMERYFGADRERIDHAHQVAAHARELLKYIDADPGVTMAAAYLHDIGIHEAERRHGSNAGRYQEIEGPPVARAILKNLGAAEDFIAAVCELVGNHHTPKGVDSPEFRILWDSDALVNLAGSRAGKNASEMRSLLDRSLVTEAGYRRALGIYL